MDLHILDHRLKVTSICKEGLVNFTHPLIKLIFLRNRTRLSCFFLSLFHRCKFFSLTETPENYTVVLDEEGFKDSTFEVPRTYHGMERQLTPLPPPAPVQRAGRCVALNSGGVRTVPDSTGSLWSFLLTAELPPSEYLQVEGSTWLPLNVVSNGHASSSSQAVGVTKIAKSVIAPLAEQHVSVFMLSTYQTDFILVREKDLAVVVHTLEEEFNIYREEGGESIPVHSQDVRNGLQKNGKEVGLCFFYLFFFYYHNSPKEGAPSSQDLDCIKFFSFSLIDGYISLVMDTEAQRQFPADLLFTSSSGELWRMVRIGGQPLGFDECGIVAQISQPLADSDISAYYISTFSFDHALVRAACAFRLCRVPEEDISSVISMLQQQRQDPAPVSANNQEKCGVTMEMQQPANEEGSSPENVET
ncbi:hypothetical protein JZ751_023499, partial [Albula glossodonta]